MFERVGFKVGIIYSKPNKLAVSICQKYSQSVLNQGDQIVSIHSLQDIPKLKFCQVIFQISEYNPLDKHPSPHVLLRKKVKEYCKDRKIRRLIVDSGVVKDGRNLGESEDRYLAIGFDKIKRAGLYYNENSPPDRWNQLGAKIKDWRKNGKFVLVLGQSDNGVSTCHLNGGIKKWYSKIFNKIRKYTDRPILFKPHPNGRFEPSPRIKKFTILSGSNRKNIEKYLKNVWICVSCTTNGGVLAALNGIPVYTDQKNSFVYPVAEHKIENIESPIMPEREQYFYDLAYTQYHVLKDIKSGFAWKRLRQFV